MVYLYYSIAIVILAVMSAFFSATETAFSSISKVRLKCLSESDNLRDRMLVALGDNFEKLISTILIGNNIVNIAAATLATILFSKVFQDESIAGVVSTITITVFILLFSEVMPKTIAKKNPETIARGAAPIVLVFFYLLYPLNYIVGLWQKLINLVFKKEEDIKITDEELMTYVEEAESEGGIDEYEGQLIKSAIEFDDLTVRDALTPRVDIVGINIKSTMEEIKQLFVETGYSRMPIYKDSIDNIVGILNEKDFYKAYMNGAKNIKGVMNKNLILVPLTNKLSDLLRQLQKGKMHMAIVVGEFGGTAGIITLEDIVEEIVGEIWDEHDEVVENIRKISDDEWIFSGDVGLDELFEMFDIDQDDDDFDFVNISGLITEKLETAPEIGDTITFENLEMKVLEVEFNRVAKVQIKVLPKEDNEEENNILLKGIISDKDKESEDE